MADDDKLDQSWIEDEERLAEIARDGFSAEKSPTESEVRAMAAELLHRRRAKRTIHRLADEVRRIRWATENSLTKIEDLGRKLDEIEPELVDHG